MTKPYVSLQKRIHNTLNDTNLIKRRVFYATLELYVANTINGDTGNMYCNEPTPALKIYGSCRMTQITNFKFCLGTVSKNTFFWRA